VEAGAGTEETGEEAVLISPQLFRRPDGAPLAEWRCLPGKRVRTRAALRYSTIRE
jgi:hypothetical protein